MSMLKDGRFPIELDRTRHLCFSLNVIEEMQTRFGSLDKLPEALSGKESLKNLKWLLTMLLNEGRGEGEAELTEREVGRLIHTGNFRSVQTILMNTFAASMRVDADDVGDEDTASVWAGEEKNEVTS